MSYKKFELCIDAVPDLIIWRYISLKKFKLMIKNKALFFCRADKFPDDPFEGIIPRKELEYRIKSIDDTEINDTISNIHRNFKGHLLVNCWHINDGENDAMWQLYLKGNNGVAIKTTVKNLLDSFVNTDEKVYCSIVRYIDYEEDIWLPPTIKGYNMFAPILHKRKEFSHENELRLIHDIEVDIFIDINDYWQKQPKNEGKDIQIDLIKLIDAIYIAPKSNDTHISKIEQIVKQNGFDFPVKKSKLENEPYY